MEKQKIGKLNVLGSGLAFLITVYIAIIYILLLVGNKPGCIAYELTTTYAPYWAFRFVCCLLVYVSALANLFAVPTYFVLKAKNSSSDLKKYTAIIQFIASALMLVAVIMFWVAQGPTWLGALTTPFATPYRIVELVLGILGVGAVTLTVLWTVNDDALRHLKKKYNKM